MGRDEAREATQYLGSHQRVQFWSSFESSVETPFPAMATGKFIDDIAAVFAGSKPATMFSPRILGNPAVRMLIAEEGDAFNRLSTAQSVDLFGGIACFIGLHENVENLAKLYSGRDGEGSPLPADTDFHRAVGQNLGYTDEAIADFLTRTELER